MGALHEYHHIFRSHTATRFSQEVRTSISTHGWRKEWPPTAPQNSWQTLVITLKTTCTNYLITIKYWSTRYQRIPFQNKVLGSGERNLLGARECPAGLLHDWHTWATATSSMSGGRKVVLRDWYLDIPRIGKSASFRKHMGLSLKEFYPLFIFFSPSHG